VNAIRSVLGVGHMRVPLTPDSEKQDALRRLTEQRLRLLRVSAGVSVTGQGKTPGERP